MTRLEMLGTTSSSDFGGAFWGQKPHVQRAAMPLHFTEDDFIAILESQLPYRHDCVRVSRARDEDHDNRQTLDLARDGSQARWAFMAGQSVTLNHLQRFLDQRHPLMTEFRALCRMTGCTPDDVQLAVFHSAANGRAFGAHTDPNHVFVVQLVGEKIWDIGPKGEEERIVLAPGDTLYLPYGYRHSVSAGDSKSLSLSFIVRPTTWQDLLVAAFARQVGRTTWGDPSAALPWGWIDEDPERVAPDALDELVDRTDLVAALAAAADQTLPRLPASAQVLVSDPGEVIGPMTRVLRGWDARLRVTPKDGQVQIAAAGRPTLVCPAPMVQLLTAVPDEGSAVHELQGPEDPGERLAVVRQLIQDGYLRPLPQGREDVVNNMKEMPRDLDDR